jgi:hypothetical protein
LSTRTCSSVDALLGAGQCGHPVGKANAIMQIDIEDLRNSIQTVEDVGGAEAAIIAQFALDLALTAKVPGTQALSPEAARHLLKMRLSRYRASLLPPTMVVH